MNILFEIADSDLIVLGIILVAILIVATIIFKAAMKDNKVEPISEDERFDNDNEETVKSNTTQAVKLTDEQQKAKEELERVYNQMSSDLEKQEKQHDDIDSFEKEQEENAIISYKELMAQAEKLKQEANKYEAKVENKADTKPQSGIDTLKDYEEQEEKPAYHGFKNSEIISPIYGIQKEHNEKSSPNRQSNGIIGRAYEEVDAESEKEQNMEFLNSLKEFRKNL